MQKIFILGLALFSVAMTFGQRPAGGQGRGGQAMNIGHFYGKIVDSKSNKGVDAASVQLLVSKFDTITKKAKDSLVSGMLTKPNGDFSLENLPVFGNYRLAVTAIGYKPIELKVAFQMRRPEAGAGA